MQPSNTQRDFYNAYKKSSPSQNCAICRPSDPQTNSILHALLQKFILKKNGETSGLSLKQCDKFELITFGKLLSIVFGKKYLHFKATTTCSHKELKIYFCTAIDCSQTILDQFSHVISWQRAKYHYHIDVLNQQVRSFPRILAPQYKKKQRKAQKLIDTSTQKNKQISPPILGNQQKKQKSLNSKNTIQRESNQFKSNNSIENQHKNNAYAQFPPYQMPDNPQMGSYTCFNPMNFMWACRFPTNQNFNPQFYYKSNQKQ